MSIVDFDMERKKASVAAAQGMGPALAMAQDQDPRLVAAVLGALSLAAFVCDRNGRVLASTRQAEQLLGDGPLKLERGVLSAQRPNQAAQLARLIRTVADCVEPAKEPLALTSSAGPLVLDIAALPAEARGPGLAARVLVVARTSHREIGPKVAFLRAMFGLTAAEADVALGLIAGRGVAEIAEARGVSVNTIRSQIKTLLGKICVDSRAALIALLAPIVW